MLVATTLAPRFAARYRAVPPTPQAVSSTVGAGGDVRELGKPGGRAQRRRADVIVVALQEPRMDLVAIDLEHGPVHRRVVAPDDLGLEVLGVR